MTDRVEQRISSHQQKYGVRGNDAAARRRALGLNRDPLFATDKIKKGPDDKGQGDRDGHRIRTRHDDLRLPDRRSNMQLKGTRPADQEDGDGPALYVYEARNTSRGAMHTQTLKPQFEASMLQPQQSSMDPQKAPHSRCSSRPRLLVDCGM